MVGSLNDVQYYKQTETYKVTLHYMNTTLTGLFTLECVMKIFSFGFRVSQSPSSPSHFPIKLVGQLGWANFVLDAMANDFLRET